MQELNKLGWNITRKCNYQCKYCITAKERKELQKKVIRPLKFVERFSQILRGGWIICLEGAGEPFCAPDFLEVVKGLVEKYFYLSISTNLSFPSKEIEKFIQVAGKNLIELGASLHPEYIEPRKFLKKLSYFNRMIPNRVKLKYVATKRGMFFLPEISEFSKKNNIKLLIFAERIGIKRGLYRSRKYSEKELALLKSATPLFWLDLAFTDKLCWAGCKHLVIQDDGSAYRCAPVRTYGSEGGLMGNIFDEDFKLLVGPKPCPAPNCYCYNATLIER